MAARVSREPPLEVYTYRSKGVGGRKSHGYHPSHTGGSYYNTHPVNRVTKERWENSLTNTYRNVILAKPTVDNETPRTWYPGTVYKKPGMSEDRNHEINRDNRGLMRRLRNIYSGDGKRHGGEESYIYRGTTPTSERAASRSRSRSRSRFEKYGRSRSRSLSATRRKEEARVIIQENARLSRRLTKIKPTISRERSLTGYLDHCSRGARVSRMNQKKYLREMRDITDVLPNPSKPRKLKPLRFLNADGSERKDDS